MSEYVSGYTYIHADFSNYSRLSAHGHNSARGFNEEKDCLSFNLLIRNKCARLGLIVSLGVLSFEIV